MSDSPKKSGPLSNPEIDVIKQNIDSKSAEEIAELINRNVPTVEKAVDKLKKKIQRETRFEGADEIETAALRQLRSSSEFVLFEDQFTPDEIGMIEQKYVSLMRQFKNDVLATEELQIMNLIRYDVLINRALKDIRLINQEMEENRTLVLEHGHLLNMSAKDRRDLSPQDKHNRLLADKAKKRFDFLQGEQKEKTRTLNSLNSEHEKLLKSLKGTRDQRIKVLDESKNSLMAVIQALSDPEFALTEGRYAEIMRLAMDKEIDFLGELHTYEDGASDRPILNKDTIEK